MDFFDHQDVARRKSGRLVVLFVLAVLAIITLVYLAVVIILGLAQPRPDGTLDLWDPMLLLYVGAGVVALVGLSSLFKVSQLSAGGHIVAEQLGGQRLDPATADFNERRLLNIVEEMALASGIPVPPVYVIEEAGINAFAAGYSANDAVIGITRGAMETLNRDELQGVVAHEFSHVLNGDMRLNIRLMGVIFGILVLSVIGYHMLRMGFYAGGGRRSRSKEGNAAAVIGLLGMALVAIGGVGAFFANLIKAAVSRQREFLADASAVQFTRNPDGIAGALKKIGGWSREARLEHPETAEVSHMLFGDGVSRLAGGLFATHPPLAERIRRIDPQFDGRFPRTQPLAGEQGTGGTPVARMTGATPVPRGATPVLQDAVAQIGQPTAAHVQYAAQLLGALPAQVRDMAHEPYGARALIYALLLDADPAVSAAQVQRLQDHAEEPVRRAVQALRPVVQQIDPAARLPLIDLATPALRQLSPRQYQAFQENVTALVRADQRINLFEWTLQRILLAHLEPHFSGARVPRIKHTSLRQVAAHCAALLSALAQVGHSDHAGATRAFEAARRASGLAGMVLLPPEQANLARVATALDELALLSPPEKRKLVQACAAAIGADQEVTVREAELFRAICDSLGAPAPPLLPGQTLAA